MKKRQILQTFGFLILLIFNGGISIPLLKAQLSLIPSPSGYNSDNRGYRDSPIVYNNVLYMRYLGDDGNYDLGKYDGTTLSIIPSPSGYDASNYGHNKEPIIYNGNLYMRYRDNGNNDDLMKYNGTTLTPVPSPSGYDGATHGYRGEAIVFDNKLYLRYRTNAGEFILVSYDGTTLTPIPNPVGYEYSSQPIVYDNALYLKYVNTTTSAYHLFKYDGTTFSHITNPSGYENVGYAGNPIVFNGKLYGQYIANTGNNVLMECNITTLTPIFPSVQSNYTNSARGYRAEGIIYNSNLYIKYRNNAGAYELYKFNGTNLALISNPSGYENSARGYEGESFVYAGKLHVSYRHNTSYYTLFTYNGTTLTEVPNPVGYTSSATGYNSSLNLNQHGIEYNGKAYMYYTTSTFAGVLFSYDGTTLTEISNPSNYTNEGVDDVSPFILFNDRLYLSYEHDDGSYDLGAFFSASLATVTTTTQANITSTTADLGGNVTNDGGATVTENGIVWGTSSTPTTSDNKVQIGTGTGIFNQTITGLPSATTVFVRAYAINSEGTSYGNQISFTTLSAGQCTISNTSSTVTQANGSDIGQSFTTCQDGKLDKIRFLAGNSMTGVTLNIKSGNGTGGATLGTLSGLGFTASGTATDFKEVDVSSLNILVTNSSNYTFYFTSASLLVENSGASTYNGGTFYFNGSPNANFDLVFEVDIITPTNTSPTVTTATQSNVTATTADLGGNVTSDGGATVTERGIVWGTSTTPTTSNNKVQIGTGTGVFNQTITGLPSATTIFVRSYAINSEGTAYGNEISFTTLNSATEIITTVAGDGTNNTTGNGTGATSSVAIDETGNIYVTTSGFGHSVRKITPAGIHSTFAGTGTNSSTGDGGLAINATLNSPTDLYISNGALYVAEGVGRYIRKIDLSTNIITTVAGDGTNNTTGNGTGATSSVAIDEAGNIYVTTSGFGHSVRKITPAGIHSTFAGTGTNSSTGDGGLAINATLNSPTDLYISNGALYVAEGVGRYIRKIDLSTNIITTVAGDGTTNTTGNGTGATSSVTVDALGNIYVTTSGFGHSVRKITPTGIYSTFAGTGTNSSTGDGGLAINATLNSPTDLYVNNGALYVAEGVGRYIRKVTTLPTINTANALNITTNTADLGGIINSGDATLSISERGIVWAITPNPTTSNNKAQIGTGVGSFSQTISSLPSNTIIYSKTYTINEGLTVYGNQISFTTLSACSAPTAQVTNLLAGNNPTVSTLDVVSYDAPTGGATGYVIKINSTNGFTAPTNAASLPTADLSWNDAGEQVIYAGTSTNPNIVVTGLDPSTQYFFRVYSYNDCAGTNTFETIGTGEAGTTLTLPLLAATITSISCSGGSTGAIDLDVSEFSGSQTYAWSDGGVTTQNRTGLSAGEYEVTITDGGTDYTATYEVGYDLTWTDLTEFTLVDKRLTKSTATTGWTSKAFSEEKIIANGGITFTAEEKDAYNYMIGLSYYKGAVGYASIRYAIYLTNAGSIVVYENGVVYGVGGTFGTYQNGDIFRIERTGTTLVYSKNGTPFRTVGGVAAGDLIADATMYTPNGRIPQVQFTSCPIALEITSFTSNTCPTDGAGAATATLLGEALATTYAWSSGENTASILNKNTGIYSVTATGVYGTRTKHVAIGYEVDFENQANVSSAGNVLTKTNATGWTSGANSASTQQLAATANGWVSNTITSNTSSYMIGLAKPNTAASYTSIDYAWYFVGNSNAVPSYNKNPGTAVAYQKGDVFTVAREGSQMKFYKNGTVVHQYTINATETLVADVAINSGSTGEVQVSFCGATGGSQTYTAAVTGIDCGTGGTAGTIDITATGATYVWSNGANTANITGLSAGTYQLELTKDGITYNASYLIGAPLTWTNLTNLALNANGQLDHTSTTGWNTNANSTQKVIGNGGIVFNVDNATTSSLIGLSKKENGTAFNSIEYAIYTTSSGKVYVVEKGVNKGDFGSYQTGDGFKIERVGTEIRYSKNGSVFYTSTSVTTQDLVVDAGLYTANTTLPKVLFINCALDLSISAPLLDCGVSTGSATATVTGGTFATTYIWKNAANATVSTTNTLSNQPAGYYTVTASGAFSSITKNVVLSYPVDFVVEADVTTSGATVNKTTGTTAWDAGVHTTNTLAANQDGFVENTVAQNISYMFGLTTQNTTPYFSSIKYRWYVLANGKAIAGYTPSSGVIIDYQVGDKLRVERVASVIKYFHNNVEITQQSIDASEELIADVAIYTPNGNAGSYKVSFCPNPATRIATKVKANQNEFEQDTFSVYPNPSTGIVNVRFETALAADTQVTVFDGIGRKVSSQKFQKGKNELKINLTNQPKGMYLIHFNQNGATYSKAIIIE
ncbi:T9SS type A sorting domain-containing protein [Bernardetia sp. MNP-M8]|uniref:T9SS type A sorting domain-containing protein n=1 Tax=Bernardetia sp. MNP-M8 TaxID=3127470 RepID=UPI0030D176A4